MKLFELGEKLLVSRKVYISFKSHTFMLKIQSEIQYKFKPDTALLRFLKLETQFRLNSCVYPPDATKFSVFVRSITKPINQFKLICPRVSIGLIILRMP